MAAVITDICRYPVKGLSAEHLEQVAFEPGQGLPHDRRFALADGATAFDSRNPQWLPKTHFLMLMRDEKLAQLTVRFDPDSGELSIERDGRTVVHAKATEALGRTVIGQFIAGFMAGSTRGAPRLLEAPGHSFHDSRGKYVSIVNRASVRDLERVVRREVHPLRFRANIYIDGTAAWSELSWTGRPIRLGGAGLEVVGPIDRCAATNVNPETAERDLNIPLALQRGFGHVDMGVYATVRTAGEAARGDPATLPG
jgi:uncharacterized protein YcbX